MKTWKLRLVMMLVLCAALAVVGPDGCGLPGGDDDDNDDGGAWAPDCVDIVAEYFEACYPANLDLEADVYITVCGLFDDRACFYECVEQNYGFCAEMTDCYLAGDCGYSGSGGNCDMDQLDSCASDALYDLDANLLQLEEENPVEDDAMSCFIEGMTELYFSDFIREAAMCMQLAGCENETYGIGQLDQQSMEYHLCAAACGDSVGHCFLEEPCDLPDERIETFNFCAQQANTCLAGCN